MLATRPIEVVAAEVALSAPDTAEIGGTLKVEWTGPGGRYDAVELFDPSAKNGEGKVIRAKRLRNDDFENKTVSLTAPGRTGGYQLRYWNGDNKKVLATKTLDVVDAEVSLTLPDTIEQAQTIKVEWIGPGGRYDEVQVYDPSGNNGSGKVRHKKRLRNDDFDNRTARLPAPAKTGDYELRYWNGENKVVLATVPFTVVETIVTLTAPDQVPANQLFVVEWAGPGARLDDLQILDQNGKSVRGRRLRNADFDNRRVKIKAPPVPGTYTLRYWNGENKAALATRPISVE